MFQLQITVQSIEEAERLLACLKHSADPAAVKQVESQIPFNALAGLLDAESPAKKHFPNTTNTAGEPAAPKKPRGRPRREVAPPVTESAAPEAEAAVTPKAEAEAPAQQTYTREDARQALMDLQAKTPGDLTGALAILEKFDAKRVSEVKDADYAKFIAACHKAA